MKKKKMTLQTERTSPGEDVMASGPGFENPGNVRMPSGQRVAPGSSPRVILESRVGFL